MPSATSSGADASKSSGTARNRDHNQGNQERKYTTEQAAAVVRIRRCNGTAFYEILELQKSCTDTEIKKAYRKQSLLTHPDKNGHPNADEAFKMVSRAFGVLGDKDKRDMYDRSGADPDSRFASAQAQNPFAGFAQRRPGGGMGGQGRGMWNEEEISPEEMFRQFFGGGMFGGGFDTGPGFVFNMNGGPGIRIHQFGGARPRGRPRQGEGPQQEQSSWQTLVTLLPILIFIVLPILQSLFSGVGAPSYPTMNFDKPHSTMTREQTTKNGVKFFISEKDWATYKGQQHKINDLHNYADVTQIRILDAKCNREMLYKQQLREEAQGWFYQDTAKMEQANSMEMPACEKLEKLQRGRARS